MLSRVVALVGAAAALVVLAGLLISSGVLAGSAISTGVPKAVRTRARALRRFGMASLVCAVGVPASWIISPLFD